MCHLLVLVRSLHAVRTYLAFAVARQRLSRPFLESVSLTRPASPSVIDSFPPNCPPGPPPMALHQVHLATLKTGERVVVKVQRPGLKSLFDIDLKNIR